MRDFEEKNVQVQRSLVLIFLEEHTTHIPPYGFCFQFTYQANDDDRMEHNMKDASKILWINFCFFAIRVTCDGKILDNI